MSAIEILAVIGVIGYVVKDGKVFTGERRDRR